LQDFIKMRERWLKLQQQIQWKNYFFLVPHFSY
jgi:hypothetical protein